MGKIKNTYEAFVGRNGWDKPFRNLRLRSENIIKIYILSTVEEFRFH
jgi:hypothetical protein